MKNPVRSFATAALALVTVLSASLAHSALDPSLVAWWPFGDHGLSDASGNGYSLSAGTAVEIGDSVALNGTSSGNANSLLSVSGIPFSEMDAITVELWIRYSTIPNANPVFEVSPNSNDKPGAFNCFFTAGGGLSSGRTVGSDIYSMVKSSSAVLAEKIGEWRHIVAVYPKGPNSSFRLYVDGVNVAIPYSTAANRTADCSNLAFANDTLYFGSRSGKGYFSGEMDSIKIWNRVLTAEEVLASYEHGEHKATLFVSGSPVDVPCAQMEPAYGAKTCTNGERIAFSAACAVPQVRMVGWCVQTNVLGTEQYEVMASGAGTSGSFIHPGGPCKLEWQFVLPPTPVISFASPVEISAGTATFSFFISPASAGELSVKAVWGTTPENMNQTNELMSVSSPGAFDGAVSGLPLTRAICLRLIAVGASGECLAASPIKVCRCLDASMLSICHYPFGEAGYRDVSRHGLDLTATGSCVLENGAVTLKPGAGARTLHTANNLNLSTLDSYVVSCWFRSDVPENAPILMEQMVSGSSYNNFAGAFCINWDSGTLAYQGSLRTSNGAYAIVTSDQRDWDAEWHSIAIVFAKKNYPDDIKVYIDGVNCSHETTKTHKSSFTGETFANTQLWLGGRGEANVTTSGQMDEVMVTSCPDGAEDALVADIHGKGLLAVKGEWVSDSVTVEVPGGCPADQVYPPVGSTYGYALGETVLVVAEGEEFGQWQCTLSTNVAGSAEWKTWRRLRAASGSFQHPGVPVKVSWRKKAGLVLSIY